MFRLFKSWRPWRWLAFGASLAADAYAFYIAKPFTPESFQAAGLIALILFLLFLEVGRLMRGRGRILAALNDEDQIVYQVGQHLAVRCATSAPMRLHGGPCGCPSGSRWRRPCSGLGG